LVTAVDETPANKMLIVNKSNNNARFITLRGFFEE